MQASKRLARPETLRRVIGVEPFTVETAEHHADISPEFVASGNMIPQNDIAEAAVAGCLIFGVFVGPKDEEHFQRIAGLDVKVLRVAELGD